jgi:hypothetical protein
MSWSSLSTRISSLPNVICGPILLKTNENEVAVGLPLNLTPVDDLGQLHKIISLNESNNNTVSIDEFANGIYFVVGRKNNEFIKQKIIVNR